MKRITRYTLPAALILPIPFLILFRTFPQLSHSWTASFIRPFGLMLHRLTAQLHFPAFELIIIAVPGIFLFCGMRALFVCACRKSISPICIWLKRAFYMIPALLFTYAFLWYPAYWAEPGVSVPVPDAGQLKWLCKEIIAELNESELRFSSPEKILSDASAVCGIDGAVAKPARYPEWMHLFHIAGLYVPWTGEAIISTQAPNAALPFTAIHELMHLGGIADEGSANIAAWNICNSVGGEFLDSARLWVLKYAFEMLEKTDPACLDTLYTQMDADLFSLFSHINGKSQPSGTGMLLSALGLVQATSSYPVVVSHILNAA